MAVNLKAELEASKSLVDLLELADRTRQLYQSARLPLPDALRRLLGSNNTQHDGYSATLAQSAVPPNPPEAEHDWAWVPLSESAPVTLIKALLRRNDGLRSKELYEQIAALEIEASLGTVSNAAVRLESHGIIVRDVDSQAWKLVKPEMAGVIGDGYVWGPPDSFTMQELAAHRRQAILQLLGANHGGLQLVQLTEELRKLGWVRAPINKDLLKGDMDWLLGKHKVRRIGNSRKWGLALES